jgi:hypothetical protein
VDDRIYTGNTMNFVGPCVYSMPVIKTLTHNWHRGATVKVYFNPNDPAEAVLRRDYPNPWSILGWLAIPALVVDALLRHSGHLDRVLHQRRLQRT